MRLSLKQKQVLGVTLMVALIVIALSLVHLTNTAGVLLAESRDRFDLYGSSVYTQAASAITNPDTAYGDVRSSRYVQSVLQSALYSQDIIDAFIVDPTGVVIASSDAEQVGKTLARRPQLNDLITLDGVARLRAIYASENNIEWTQPMALREAVWRDPDWHDDGADSEGFESVAVPGSRRRDRRDAHRDRDVDAVGAGRASADARDPEQSVAPGTRRPGRHAGTARR